MTRRQHSRCLDVTVLTDRFACQYGGSNALPPFFCLFFVLRVRISSRDFLDVSLFFLLFFFLLVDETAESGDVLDGLLDGGFLPRKLGFGLNQ